MNDNTVHFVVDHHNDPYVTCCCGKHSILVEKMDRVFHTDGSDNKPCWRRISLHQGSIEYIAQRITQ